MSITTFASLGGFETLAIGTPPSSHFIYIPVIFALGITLGFLLGSKATRDAIAFEQKKTDEREARRAAREAARAAKPPP
jgi:hypothetical protein